MEQDGEKYYRELADKANSSGLKSIFLRLANDEKRHQQILDNIEKNFDFCDDKAEVNDEETVFSEKLKEINDFHLDKSHIETYEYAAKLEKESIEFYTEKREGLERKCERMTFNRLIKEEKKHLEELEFVIRHLRKPNEWVEDAEFTHGEEY
nr:ferritin family protein [Sporosalibacterium faouarense]